MMGNLIFGDDVFISYSRKDGALYAAGVADKLTAKGLTCFIDKLGTEPDDDLPESLKKKIRGCLLFVLVGTEKASASEFVENEISEFKKTRRTIVPIDFDGAIGRARWYPLIRGLAAEEEKNPEALLNGDPSPSVISWIEKSFRYTRRNIRMRRLLWVTLAIFLILVVASAGAAFLASKYVAEAAEQGRRAVEAGNLADQKTEEAALATALAQQKTREAEEATGLAGRQTALARQSEENARQARTRELTAVAAADRQETIAFSHEMANQASLILRHQPSRLSLSVASAVQAMQSLDRLGMRSLGADLALRNGLSLLPRVRSRMEFDGGFITVVSADGRYAAYSVELSQGNEEPRWMIRVLDLFAERDAGPPIELNAQLIDMKLSARGRYVAAICAANEQGHFAQIWDPATGRPVGPLVGPRAESFITIEFSPDERLFAAANDDLSLEIRDLRPGQPVIAPLQLPKAVDLLRFSSDGRYLATATRYPFMGGGEDAFPRIWDLELREPLQIDHEDARIIEFSPDGRFFVTVDKNELRFWDWHDHRGDPAASPKSLEGPVDSVAFSGNGKYLAMTGQDGIVRIFGINREIKIIKAEDRLVASRSDFEGRELKSFGEINRLTLDGTINAIAFSPDSRYIATAGRDRTARVWEVDTGRELSRMGHDHEMTLVAFSDDGAYLTSVSNPSGPPSLAVVHGISGALPSSQLDLLFQGETIGRSPDGLFWIVREDSELIFFQHSSSQAVSSLREDGERGFNIAAISPDHRYLVTGLFPGISRFADDEDKAKAAANACLWESWNTSHPRRLRCFPTQGSVIGIAFSRSRRNLAIVSFDDQFGTLESKSTIIIWEGWDTAAPRMLAQIVQKGKVESAVFDPHGELLATKTTSEGRPDGADQWIHNNAVQVWNWRVSTEKPAAEFKFQDHMHSDAVRFSPDGDFLLTGDGSSVLVWRWRERAEQPIARLSHSDRVESFDFSADGRYLATTSSDSTTHVWESWRSGHPVEVSRWSGWMPANDVVFSPGDKYIITNGFDGVHTWLWTPRDLIAEATDRLK